MRQACNHPALITGDSIDDADALDPTPERQPSSSSAAKTAGDDDDLLAALGGMSLSSTAAADPGPTCLLCSKPPLHKGTYCSSCQEEMAKYKGLTQSTKIQHVLKLLEEIKRESDAEKVRIERENRRKREETPDSDDEDLGAKPVEEKWKPKKTIIFSQVRFIQPPLCS
jgi:hypothetical protein